MTKTRPYLVAAILATMDEGGTRQLYRAEDFDFCEAGKQEIHVDPIQLATAAEIYDAMEHLVAEGLIEKIEDPYTKPEFTIADFGRQYFFERKQDRYSLEARYRQRGVSWLGEALENIHREEENPPSGEGAFQSSAFQSNAFQVADEDHDHPVPASDRYVSAKDNQPLINEMRGKIEELTDAISENRDNDFDDKEGRLAELAALDLLLSQPQISVPLVEKILSDTITYLAKRFADVMIGQVAVEILKLAASAPWTRL